LKDEIKKKKKAKNDLIKRKKLEDEFFFKKGKRDTRGLTEWVNFETYRLDSLV
jgi:hypothetical protein